MLPPDSFSRILECIRGTFDLSTAAEISVEMNPGTVQPQTIDTLLSLGINRFSMGVQSFHDDELKMLGRIHSAGEAIETIETMKKAGVENFSVDLLYGIPGQTSQTWEETLSITTGLSASHISAYELTPEKETPLCREIASGRITMPDEELVVEMHRSAIDLLSSSGYEQYEISNYAMPGSRCLHNCNYWDRGEYIGAGAGAHSFVGGFRFLNTGNIESYITQLEADVLPEENRYRVSHEAAAREFLFLGLRKTEGISLERSVSMGLHVEGICRDLIEEGYIANTGGSLRLTPKGLIISNTLIVTLFERLGL